MKLLVLCLLASLALWGQAPPPDTVDHIKLTTSVGMAYERMPMQSIKGAPYSATTATESVQTLADGNRITNRQSGRAYRDSDGRTRQDQEIKQVGQWVSSSDGFSIVMINDPVAKQHITLDTRNKTAVRMSPPTPDAAPGAFVFHQRVPPPGAGAAGADTVAIQSDRVMAPAPGVAVGGSVTAVDGKKDVMFWKSAEAVHVSAMPDSKDVKSQSLGKQMMEGVQVEGTRETFTIPAGQMGNEKAIDVVTERWYSPELKIDVLRKHVDPRFGETTYRVTGISRSEPSRMLFEVPPDYKVEEPTMHFISSDKK